MGKSIAVLSMIKNECDIIEMFVRYTLAFADCLIIVDNGSVDGTLEILDALFNEGLNIEVHSEANVYYEQLKLENKYINRICKSGKYDIVIPLDADEFLASDGDIKRELERIHLDRIEIVKWRTFCLDESSYKRNEELCFDSIISLREGEKKPFTKIIIPCKLYDENEMLITMGHHDVVSVGDYRHDNNNIFVAHFPVRSEEQLRKKIYQGIIGQLMSNYNRIVAFQWRELYIELQSKKLDIVKYSKEYALAPGEDIYDLVWIDKPLNVEWCRNKLHIEYNRFRYNDLCDIIMSITENMCIQKTLGTSELIGSKRIVVYGTGNTAHLVFDTLNTTPYEIVAYIDSDRKKEFTSFNNRIILSPQRLRFIDYDLVVIASRSKDEIEDELRHNHINMDKVVDYSYFVRKVCDN